MVDVLQEHIPKPCDDSYIEDVRVVRAAPPGPSESLLLWFAQIGSLCGGNFAVIFYWSDVQCSALAMHMR